MDNGACLSRVCDHIFLLHFSYLILNDQTQEFYTFYSVTSFFSECILFKYVQRMCYHKHFRSDDIHNFTVDFIGLVLYLFSYKTGFSHF